LCFFDMRALPCLFVCTSPASAAAAAAAAAATTTTTITTHITPRTHTYTPHHARAHTRTHAHAHTYTHARAHTRTHTHTHVQTTRARVVKNPNSGRFDSPAFGTEAMRAPVAASGPFAPRHTTTGLTADKRPLLNTGAGTVPPIKGASGGKRFVAPTLALTMC
jgi:hypothetical protein